MHRNELNFVNAYYLTYVLVINVILLNMVIAVLGDTYDKVTEKRAQWVKLLKMKVLNSLIPVLPNKEKQDVEDVFMIIVKPIDDPGNAEEDWNGKINKIVEMT